MTATAHNIDKLERALKKYAPNTIITRTHKYAPTEIIEISYPYEVMSLMLYVTHKDVTYYNLSYTNRISIKNSLAKFAKWWKSCESFGSEWSNLFKYRWDLDAYHKPFDDTYCRVIRIAESDEILPLIDNLKYGSVSFQYDFCGNTFRFSYKSADVGRINLNGMMIGTQIHRMETSDLKEALFPTPIVRGLKLQKLTD
jgi:hypothetical protein